MEDILKDRAAARALKCGEEVAEKEYTRNMKILAETTKDADSTLIPNLRAYLVELLHDKNLPIG